MKYYLDTEFHEHQKQLKVLGTPVGKPIDTIELISIGIVAEDGREFYAICNEFDLKAAWNNEWLRKNVLMPLGDELISKDPKEWFINFLAPDLKDKAAYCTLKRLIKKYGYSKRQIAQGVKEFAFKYEGDFNQVQLVNNPKFYAYYADYDWVVFCWLFGRMMDLPKGFPMYCKDLKQELDEKQKTRDRLKKMIDDSKGVLSKHEEHKLIKPLNLKHHPDYPKQENEHNALDDAKWNMKLHQFISSF